MTSYVKPRFVVAVGSDAYRENWDQVFGKRESVRMLLWCPQCRGQHVDRDEWATREHRTHLCEHCGNEWRPFDFATVGVP